MHFTALHESSKSLEDFKLKMKDTGADFPDSFLETTDRLILSMHPKYKKKSTANGEHSGKENGVIDEAEKKRRMFPGLALPNQEWQPSVEKDVFMKEVDNMMAQLEDVQKKKKEESRQSTYEERAPKRRRSRSRSPQRRSQSPPRGRRDDRYNDRGRRQQLDERPILYKIYNGRVQTLKDFGAFIALEGVVGRVEGESSRPIACICAHPNSRSRACVGDTARRPRQLCI